MGYQNLNERRWTDFQPEKPVVLVVEMKKDNLNKYSEISHKTVSGTSYLQNESKRVW